MGLLGFIILTRPWGKAKIKPRRSNEFQTREFSESEGEIKENHFRFTFPHCVFSFIEDGVITPASLNSRDVSWITTRQKSIGHSLAFTAPYFNANKLMHPARPFYYGF